MTRHVISNTVTNTVTLGSDGYGDMLRVTSKGTVGPTVHGAAAIIAPETLSSAMVTIEGYVIGGPGFGTHIGGAGIDFETFGTVQNGGIVHGGNGAGTKGSTGGVGVMMTAGGTLTNTLQIIGGYGASNSGTGGVAGDGAAAVMFSGNGTIANSGILTGGTGGSNGTFEATVGGGGGGIGLVLGGSGGVIVNTGTIDGGKGGSSFASGGNGGSGVYLTRAMTMANAGTISGGYGGSGIEGSYGYGGNGGVGVGLSKGGTLTNHGLIEGGHGGFDYSGGSGGAGVVLGAAGVVSNDGTIMAGADGSSSAGYYFGPVPGGDGVSFLASGTLVNHGVIVGGQGGIDGFGAVFYGAAQVTNDGTIMAYQKFCTGTGMSLRDGGTLVNHGLIAGASTADGLDATGVSVNDTGVIDGGTTPVIAYYYNGVNGGAGVSLTGGQMHLSGTVQGGDGQSSHYDGGNGGAGVVLDNATLSTSGTITAGLGGRGYVDGAAGTAVVVEGHDTITALAGAVFNGAFAGFSTGDAIDLRTVDAKTIQYSHGTLTLYGPGHTVVDTLTFDGAYMASDFAIHSDGHGGTDITYVGKAEEPSAGAAVGGGSLVPEHNQLAGALHAYLHHFGG